MTPLDLAPDPPSMRPWGARHRVSTAAEGVGTPQGRGGKLACREAILLPCPVRCYLLARERADGGGEGLRRQDALPLEVS